VMIDAFDFAAVDDNGEIVTYVSGDDLFDGMSRRSVGSIIGDSDPARCWVDTSSYQTSVWVNDGRAYIQAAGYGTFGYVTPDGSINRQGADSGSPFGRIGRVVAGTANQHVWPAGTASTRILLAAGAVAVPLLIVSAGGHP
jgi:hypothetical protein